MDEQYLTVTALTSYIKKKFDVDPYLQKIYLSGEISNFRIRPGHQYFSLKDENSKINAVMFKSAFSKVKFQPEEGMKVLVSGRVSVFPGNGGYQIYIDNMQPDGIGALYQAYQQLKEKLAKEGLFTIAKKTIPKFPKKIAVVTSPSGAVIRDIITTVRRRYPIAQIVLFPAQVQGEGASADITRQIKRANQLASFDTLIIGRGGGSIEDLWPFNEENVARAIFDSELPVISSVGHETDTTIADLVADVRAATPTAAAELATPVLTDELVNLEQQRIRVINATKNLLDLKKQSLKNIKKSFLFSNPERLYEGYVQNLDLLKQRLFDNQRNILEDKRKSLEVKSLYLSNNDFPNRIKLLKQTVINLSERNKNAAKQQYLNKNNRFASLAESLDHLSPLKIMGRGYSYVTSNNKVIKNATDLKPSMMINLHFSDGEASAEIKKIEKENLENG
ncbi:exodeoxyribonuclease VII large subunit [Pediococcus claussenii]|uniref:Exodeoxyribonuclease 7 large subunit n=1 Tax=Pediococcus claussenii (strain ATCC BAA-344 / DSM 14800 / JCM 18046 / KCTC 3811 / LMG 21948 / P06) TaxID=701521 RepID=G8PDJ5_PEDCP|nr:exodeoxyribonuclease VII large subunit [Pediococcus claussenii]AEV95330.1 exodeoxyribonuclease VII, large subunit [Pediococcus claussenii ATCC BAA-344]ANZ68862.1 exodeoxyribonuclease VII large subunit [Pediococcus claussenii]ANZ70678.1 exodeoxyribonuclease VII large subunit [Pediococcus claussenii]KRN19488.1 xseA protein [Pediococcus claussenii]